MPLANWRLKLDRLTNRQTYQRRAYGTENGDPIQVYIGFIWIHQLDLPNAAGRVIVVPHPRAHPDYVLQMNRRRNDVRAIYFACEKLRNAREARHIEIGEQTQTAHVVGRDHDRRQLHRFVYAPSGHNSSVTPKRDTIGPADSHPRFRLPGRKAASAA